MERLQKVLSNCGVASRRKAEQFIVDGRVKINGKIVTSLGVKVSSHDKIEVDDQLISHPIKVYYLLNKPRGVISSVSDEKGRKTVVDIIDTDTRIYPIGRLDYDTTGVLLLTNDGEFANILMHPAYAIDKVYLAKVRGIVTADAVKMLKKGIVVDSKKIKADRVKIRKKDIKTNTSFVELTIHEGINHQVKKMFAEVGYEVLKLKRQRVAIFDLTHLPSGCYRKLTPKEVAIIYGMKKNK